MLFPEPSAPMYPNQLLLHVVIALPHSTCPACNLLRYSHPACPPCLLLYHALLSRCLPSPTCLPALLSLSTLYVTMRCPMM
ncbi:hypothetical protein C8Q74DRAFT_556168 [Fomes fomentarius]|nr:hypothetical protein C8Q74DRAFT_556168 [Fomes fomentarius]